MGITFGARDGGKSTSALGCKAVVMDSVAHVNLVFFVHGLPTETQMVKRKAASNESFIFFLFFFVFGAGAFWGSPGKGVFSLSERENGLIGFLEKKKVEIWMKVENIS